MDRRITCMLALILTVTIPLFAAAPVARDVQTIITTNEIRTIYPRMTDADGDALSIVYTTNGSKGTVTHATAYMIYTPNAGATGLDSFTYRVSDGGADSNTATVYVDIKNLGDVSGLKVVLLVNDLLYPEIQSEVQRLKTDMQNEGYAPEIIPFTGLCTAEDVWNKLVSEYDDMASLFAGAILIGHFPLPNNSLNSEPTDCVYWNLHDFGPVGKFDIWVTRISASAASGGPLWAGDEVSLIKRALDANHGYRTGAIRYPDKGFHYDNVGGGGDGTGYMDTLLEIFSDAAYVQPRDAFPAGSQMINETSHGQEEEYNLGYVSNWKIHDLLSLSHFVNVTSCSSGAIGGVTNNQIFTRGGGNVYSVGATVIAYVGAFEICEYYSAIDAEFRARLAAGDTFGRALVEKYAYADYLRPIFYGDLSLPVNMFPSNAMPQVDSLTKSQSSGTAPLTITFTAAASDADGPAGAVSAWEWFLEGHNYGKSEPLAAGVGGMIPAQSHTYLLPHIYMARVEVIDAYGARAYKETDIKVAPEPGKPLRVNCGNLLHKRTWQKYYTPELDLIDDAGLLWLHDQEHLAGTWGLTEGANYLYGNSSLAVAGTTNDTVYQSWRITDAGHNIAYSVPLVNGDYQLTLHFADMPNATAGQRLLDVSAEGAAWLDNFDIVAASGGQSTAVSQTATITVSDGSLDFVVSKDASSTLEAVLNAFAIVPVGAANAAPVISAVADQSGTVNASCGPIAFTVSDTETDDGALAVYALSSDQSIVRDVSLVLGGSGGNRSLTISPETDAYGAVDITLILTDGDKTDSTVFTLTINADLTVMHPDGGETFIGNQIMAAQWDSPDGAGNIKVEFFNGSAWSTVAASTPNDGEYRFALPGAAAAGCRVRVSDASDGDPSDTSDGTFSITAFSDADGDGMDDAWETGQGLNPADASDGGTDGDGDGAVNLQEFLNGTDPGSGSSVPDPGIRNDAAVPVTVTFRAGESGYGGCTDTYVTAQAPDTAYGNQPNMRAWWYNGGQEQYEALLHFDLSSIPAAATVTDASLSLWQTRINMHSASDVISLNKVTSAWTDSMTWNDGLPSSVPSGLATPSVAGYTGVTPPTPELFEITGMDGLVQSWVNTPADNYGMQFFVRSNLNIDFATSEYGTVQYRPKLSITYEESGGGSPNSAPVLSAPAPAAALSVTAGSPVNFTAAGTDADPDSLTYAWDVDASDGLAFTDGSGTSFNYASGYASPGIYLATVRVVDGLGGEDYATVTVTVTGAAVPAITVSYPNGGESLIGGQTCTVQWASSDFTGNVRIEWYNGSVWADIIASTADDGSHDWVLPIADHTGCQVKVSAAVGGSPADQSNSAFTISQPADADGDGMDDTWEMTNFGNYSQDQLSDYDDDGLLDVDEFIEMTDPKDQDTDDDTLLDGIDPEPLIYDPAAAAPPASSSSSSGGCLPGPAAGWPVILLGLSALVLRKRHS